jgi:hypothetical protein
LKEAPMIRVQIDYAADSGLIQLWAAGHHDPESFRTACELALKQWDGRRVSLAAKPVIFEHWRVVLADAHTRACGTCDYLHVKSKSNVGASPVTILDSWLPLQ